MSAPRNNSRTPVDWARLKQRVAQVDEALAQAYAPSPQQRRAALEARARALASMKVADASGGLEVITFVLGQQAFAIDASHVHEVRALDALTTIPCTAVFVSGIINVHGRIIAVIDLRKFLELPESGLSDLNKVIILQRGEVEFGILADRIVGAERVPLDDVEPMAVPLPATHAACVRGALSERLVVLNAQGLFDDRQLVVDDEVFA